MGEVCQSCSVTSQEVQQAAEKALRYVYPNLSFTYNQITPDAAYFAFASLCACSAIARSTKAIFDIYSAAVHGATGGDWKKFGKESVQAVLDLFSGGGKPEKNSIASSVMAWRYLRLLQHHLIDPETFPCPEIDIGNTAIDRWVFGDLAHKA